MDIKKPQRAIVTHFDGDPFILAFWLKMYTKYWRGEVDIIYMSIAYKPEIITEKIIEYEKQLLENYPEIKVFWQDRWEVPELANARLLKTEVKEPYIGLIESDGFIYGRGIVDQCFRLLEQGQDIVAPKWCLIDKKVAYEVGTEGFMRCFFFIKKDIFNKIDIDFLPKNIKKGDMIGQFIVPCDLALDCFGWISLQLALLKPVITYTPANLIGYDTNDWLEPLFGNFKWVHIRQMSSSALGLGGDEFRVWYRDTNEIIDRVFRIFNEDLPDGAAEWIYKKAIAFKLLFWEQCNDKERLGDFANEYKLVLDTVADYYAIPKEKIYELKGFFRGLFEI